jgi:kynurenine formamidase
MASELIETIEKYRNWGKWGPDDQLGTLNYITAEKRVAAAQLVKTGKVFAVGTPFDANGPQTGGLGRFNPIHTMLATGTDALNGLQGRGTDGSGYADDVVHMPLQCAAQWDSLAHIFDRGKMWNGYSAAEVTAAGAARNGIETMKDQIVSRGVLLDIARYKGVDWLETGYAITEDDLVGCASQAGVEIGRGDIVLVRTGQMAECKANGWGTYAGGDAPGLSFYTADWLYRTEIAGVATDTWGAEVRPNELTERNQPLHHVIIPNMGLLVGEIFDLDELGADCADDGVYEFLFVGPPLAITGGVGSPVNPQAIK